MLVLQTPRLVLRWFREADAPMLVELLNDADWLRFIGDRGVRTPEDAAAFVTGRLVPSYWSQGFGLWAMQLRSTQECVGMCGFVQRDFLPDPDLGYALLPAHRGRGLVREAAAACLAYAAQRLGERRVLAITAPDNHRSASVLRALAMRHAGTRTLPDARGPTDVYEWLAPADAAGDGATAAIAALAQRFFGAFTNRGGAVPAIASLPSLFLPTASVHAPTAPETALDVRRFVEPRAELLFGGRLREFEERETGAETRIDDALAQRWSRYEKAGVLDGVPFAGRGTKAMQLVRTARGWRIASLAWRDDA
jgi:RimJ/RimL family protein N-acetyltransferase